MVTPAHGAGNADTSAGPDAGVVYVIYGATDLDSFPANTLSFDTDGSISSAGETRILGSSSVYPGNQLGSSVAAGDFDGDGFADVMMSAKGGVYIVYGGGALLNSQEPIGPSGAADETKIIISFTANGGYPVTLATGDLNGDGLADVVMGERLADEAIDGIARRDVGAVYVLYGNQNLRNVTVDIRTTQGGTGMVSGANETRILGDRLYGQLGMGVTTGDVNGDGFDDAIMAPFLLPGGEAWDINGGVSEVIVVYGSPTLPATIVNLNSPPGSSGETRIFNSDIGGLTAVEVPSIASGDLNGDGIDEVLIGLTQDDVSTRDEAGSVYVVFGGADLPGSIIDSKSLPGPHGEARVHGNFDFDHLGSSVTAADINGDGIEDLMTGAIQTTQLPRHSDVYVIYGGPELLGATIDEVSVEADVHLVSGGGDNSFPVIGRVLASGGDWNDDGIADFLVSDPFYQPGGIALAVFGDRGFVEALVDVDPDTLNKKSQGRWITTYITLPEGFDVGQIAPETISISQLINGDGECLPNYLQTADLTYTPEVGDRDEDGIQDLKVKFDRQVLLPALCLGDVGITVRFLLNDGTAFMGTDSIRVISRGRQ